MVLRYPNGQPYYKNASPVEKIQEIIAEELGKETEEIKLTTDIQEDLEADSLDLFQIINEIEDEFDVKIETEDGIKTVQDLVTYVEKQTA
ncbi:acyl carrier protein [Enterococcus faecium]|nr:acyl carrier protein [Enterococcus faecium]